MILSLLFAVAAAQTFQVPAPAQQVPVTIVCPSGSAIPSGSTFTCPGSGPPPPGACNQPQNLCYTMPWASQRWISGPIATDRVICIEFTTGVTSSTNNLPRFAAAEWQSPPRNRTAVLSNNPCDFTRLPWPGAAGGPSTSITIPFAVGTGSGYGYYAVLNTQTTYWLNIKVSNPLDNPGDAQMFVDLNTYGLN